MTDAIIPLRAIGDGADSDPVKSRRADSDQGPHEAPDQDDRSALRSVTTSTFAQILAHQRVSVVLSTYQAGYLIILRSEAEAALNTHFRRFPKPMGIAASAGRLALGTQREVVEFRNMAAACAKLEPPDRHDACYLPRKCHITGDIDVHEMAWGSEQLWFVNTRFSCLCTLDGEHSFVPRWWPPFVSALGSNDRCHLNGLAMVDGRPRYVTALAATDQPEGWRKDKAHGGVLVDVDSGRIVAGRLSMPHSPRWHDGRLWLLESGDGSLGTVDLSSGRYEPLARFNGYTRGLAFCGPLAFVGLSQVRESAMFSGIPLTQRSSQRICGVVVVDTRSGQQVAYVHFQDAVQEVFAIEVLPHCFPEILEPGDDQVASSYAVPDEAMPHVATVGDLLESEEPI